MTGEKLQKVSRFYGSYLNEIIATHGAEESDPACGWGHLRDMCIQAAEEFVPAGRTEKAMRWLGYVQGVLVCRKVFTLEQVKQHSMPEVEAGG